MLACLLLLAAAAQPPRPCVECHTDQAQQWRQSLHAESLRDPLYLAMRARARDEAGQAVAGSCMTCHAVGDFTGRTAGVDCQACHLSHSDKGPDAMVVRTDLPVVGTKDLSDPHPVKADPHLADGTRCLVCHAELRNAKGVPLCTTGPEAAERPQGVGCMSCHRAHGFAGTTQAMLAQAAKLAVERTGERLLVTVSNVGAGHGLPTGSALRQIRLDVVFSDVQGRPVGDNAADASATLARFLKDADGKAPVAPWKAVGAARDTRLPRGGMRRFEYPIPEGAAFVQATLTFHRAPPAVATAMDVADLPLLRPVVMARFARALQ